jgi:hypothetical protein
MRPLAKTEVAQGLMAFSEVSSLVPVPESPLSYIADESESGLRLFMALSTHCQGL